ncbi:MAG: ABC-F family ATP-binding cassette domain-containing protein [Desulfobacteraceae bacterium]|nr:ABC-F family ATP-binding cassette domain-containing protein [Desulfobacteraceae bacterium]
MPPALMSQLIACQSLAKSFGSQQLFSGISLAVAAGERLGFIGPNGAGKSTLLKIIAGLMQPDEGRIFVRKRLKLVYLAQQDEFSAGEETVLKCLLAALDGQELSEASRYAEARRLAGVCGFADSGQPVAALSGGWKKRLAIGRALIQKPDLLLLDEPTNHLDLDAILWLEALLASAPFAWMMISHDRYFLEATSNRLVELSPQYPGGYLRVEGGWREFLIRKEAFLASQARQEEVLANKLRREIDWLSRGPKARTTKAQFRIDDAGRLRGEFQAVQFRNAQGRTMDIGFSGTERKTKKLLTARGLGKSFAGRPIFSGLDLELTPGLKVGVLGNNGSGKSTLMSILAGGSPADQGSIRLAEGVKIVFFDQRREAINQEQTLRRALAPDGDAVLYQGRSVHVAGWARRFLFRSEQLDQPVSRLSGGEQARILIANLMRQPADILLLDEPTNDLDLPSLEVLEEGLAEFPGAIVLVSHDRLLLDRLTDFVLGLDGQGGISRYADFRQWLEAIAPKPKEQTREGKAKPWARPPKRKPLTLGEELELQQMEERIAQAEAALLISQEKLGLPDIQADANRLATACRDLQTTQEEVDRLYRRWEELEAKRDSPS